MQKKPLEVDQEEATREFASSRRMLSHDPNDDTEETVEDILSHSVDEDEMKVSSSTSLQSLRLASTVSLCFCTLTHSYLLISVFPYSGFMAIELIPSVNEENAGSYAGLIASSFMIGRTVSSYSWGKWADIYGRTTVVYISLVLSSLFTLLFGMSRSFASAIVFRCFLGLSNGIIGIAKTMVSELAQGNESIETKSMALVMGMWGWGFLFSPALGGALAEPVRQYPDAAWVQRFQGLLSVFPFLLPNIVAAAFCLVSLVAVRCFVQETLPHEKRRSAKYIYHDFLRALLCSQRVSTSEEEVLPMKHVQIDGTSLSSSEESDNDELSPRDEIKDICLKHGESCLMLSTTKRPLSFEKDKDAQCPTKSGATSGNATMSSLWSQPDTRIHLIVYWIFSFVMSCIDESFPLFCISKEAGLGLSEASIGKIMSGSGVIFAVCQYFVYTSVVDRYGLYGSIKVGSVLLVPLVLLVPISKEFNTGSNKGETTWATFFYLSVLFSMLRMFALVFFSSISVAMNRTVTASHRATMNGLSMLGGSASKGLGPVSAGCLAALCFSSVLFPARFGGYVVFAVIAGFASLVAIQSVNVLEQSYEPCPDKEGTDDEH